ncbi:hypothetical protein CXZ10_16875 [Pleomorphomonas diazotrophica]|uniref:Rha family transcriptional regulator n=1 Tax=Pleomorphomonas diazotrophica TaxID=1166257 RepID=A0A1I4RQF9_9HYPH|nr:Rha family transcriptional regulator [Pleomorphomonas diazotrophica]PKR88122.1 hypothetical protein CXZ10_16875 [Pleomorphomonas diazotrophica]SFM54389.1 phage regulatory protein, rha family [Pleomorphomonas diazotrophica]
MNSLATFAAPVVRTEGNRVFATSRDVAEYFEKQHKDVMRAIRSLLKADPTLRRNFECTEIESSVGFGRRRFPAYELDRKGVTLLAMGFTGRKALRLKLAYIAAFNKALVQLRDHEEVWSGVAPSVTPDDPVVAARAWADEYEKGRLSGKQSRAGERPSTSLSRPKSYAELLRMAADEAERAQSAKQALAYATSTR